jgi:hypothetical protein
MSTVVIVVVVAIAVLIVIGLIAMFSRRSRMRSLPEESRRRYADNWRAIEMKFIDNPESAVREADSLAVSVLQERGAHMHDDHMPDELQRAREAARADERSGRSGTEGMRRAMLEYKGIVEDAVGKTTDRTERDPRREVA